MGPRYAAPRRSLRLRGTTEKHSLKSRSPPAVHASFHVSQRARAVTWFEMRPRSLLLGFTAICATACVSSEVSRISDVKYPPRPRGCPVKIFPSTSPDYNWDDVASVKARCTPAHQWLGPNRDACIGELREQACNLGGDTVYGFTDGVEGDYTIVIATVAIRKPGVHSKVGELAPKPQASTQDDACSPPCSPGYSCQNSQCVALCNPPCTNGTRCNQQRICESIAPSAHGAPDSDSTANGVTSHSP
jgi:hypothetical protein